MLSGSGLATTDLAGGVYGHQRRSRDSVATTDLAGGGGGKQRRAGGRADRAGAICPEVQFATSAGLLTVCVSTRRQGIGRRRNVRSFGYELFVVIIADRTGVFRRSGPGHVAGGGSVGLPDCRRLVRRGAGGGLHKIAPAVGGQYLWTDHVVGAGVASGHDAER